MTNYLITVNEEEIPVKKSDIDALDNIENDAASFHLLENNQGFKVNVLDSDFLSKTFILAINGNRYEVKIEDAYDQQVKKMGLLAVSAQKVNSIKAPMPGLIVNVMVEEGQEISEGTPVLVLSAMKMENIILSQGKGVVKAINAQNGDAVEKGQLIIEMEQEH